ncbi:hypothetical protein HQ529_03970, partial [Candidatus Woesearchaeota archaeon]|nr:hypothetical protein [Candidatus Woesearchaeota archaeon]
MMDMKDWVSFFVGLALAAAGALPLLNKMGVGASWFELPWMPVSIFAYIVAIAGFYLMVNSVIEITNSNSIGWLSFLIAVVVMAVGALQVLSMFGIRAEWFSLSFISHTIYYVIFLI